MNGDSAETRLTKGYLQSVEWSLTAFATVFVAGLFGAALGAVALEAAFEEPSDVQSLAFIFIGQALGNVLVLSYLSRTQGTGSWSRDFGFVVRIPDSWAILVGIVLQIAAVLVTAPIARVLDVDEGPQQEVAQIAADVEGGGDILLVLFLVVVLAPVLEEIIFRGLLLSRLLRSFSKHVAVMVSAVAFGAVHLADPQAIIVVPALILVGIALGYLALYSGDLSLPILAHAGVNSLGAVLLILSDEAAELLEPAAMAARTLF